MKKKLIIYLNFPDTGDKEDVGRKVFRLLLPLAFLLYRFNCSSNSSDCLRT